MVEVAETLPPDKDEAKSETGNSSATGVTASQTKRRKMSLQNINLGKMVEKVGRFRVVCKYKKEESCPLVCKT